MMGDFPLMFLSQNTKRPFPDKVCLAWRDPSDKVMEGLVYWQNYALRFAEKIYFFTVLSAFLWANIFLPGYLPYLIDFSSFYFR